MRRALARELLIGAELFERVHQLLRDIEFDKTRRTGFDGGMESVCPYCGCGAEHGHTPACQLAATIAAIEERYPQLKGSAAHNRGNAIP